MFEKEALLKQLGSGYTNEIVARLHRFAYISPSVLERLAAEALNEEWGQNFSVLSRYLATYIPWSLEQGRFTASENQFYVTAGHLQTRYGTPLYLVFAENAAEHKGTIPWRLVTVGTNISAPEYPIPPDIPTAPEILAGSEIVMLHDHILEDNADRVPFLAQTPRVAQMCAVSGAIQWSINRGLQVPQWYFGKMTYLIPLYLQSRENIALAPDAIAPVQVDNKSLLVRTVFTPSMPMPYANARVAVQRHDQLPSWLLNAWASYSKEGTSDEGNSLGSECGFAGAGPDSTKLYWV